MSFPASYICSLCHKPILEGEMHHALLKCHAECLHKQDQQWKSAKQRGEAAIKKLEELFRNKT